MSAKLLDGKSLATKLKTELSHKIASLRAKNFPAPCLAVILLGQDPASNIYVAHKQRACDEIGIISKRFDLPEETTTDALLSLIADLNADKSIHGILVQLPLPSQINTQQIIEAIAIEKDVDGFHPYNFGRLALRLPVLRPCTPLGIMKLLASTEIDLKGKIATVVGASNIVGRPMSLELMLAGVTVTTCHRFTQSLAYHVQQADIVVVAVGKPNLVKGEWIKPGAIVVDVGMNRLASGKLVGDLEFAAAQERASWITPVPGGVGPMTVATLLENCLFSYEIQLNLG